MNRIAEFAQENGWPATMARVFGGASRRLRDSFTERKLRTCDFRVGRAPRLLGLAHMRIGKTFRAGDSLWLEALTNYAGQTHDPQIVIGDNVNFSDRVHVACIHRVSIGEGTLIGSGVIVTDHAHGNYSGVHQSSPDTVPARRVLHSTAPVVIGRNVWLGDGVAVLAGANIGDGAIVGANSVVSGTIPPGVIAYGAPARPARRWDDLQKKWLSLMACAEG